MARTKELQQGESTGRVLLYLRRGEDVSIIRQMLAGMAAEGVVCTGIDDLCRCIAEEDVNAVLLTESALADGALPLLGETLRGQPHWSDLPLLFVAGGGLESPLAVQVMRELPNVLVLDRPVRMATLAGALHMALRMRTKQRQVRDLLDERRQAEEALAQANERLHAQADDLAAVNEQLLTEREELHRQSEELYRQSLELRQLKEQAEQTAQRMERLARSVEENPDPVLRVWADGRIHYANPAAFTLCHRWNSDERLRVPPAIQGIVSEAYLRTATIRREMTFGKHTYLITAAPAPRPARYVNIFASDITERKGAEEALRASEERHRRLLANLKGSHFVYRHDTEGVFQYLSDSVTDVLGYAPEEGMAHYSRLMTDHPANQAVHRHTDLSIQGIPQPPYEVQVRHKDGSTRWLEVQEVPVLDESGRVIAVEGVAQDITARKEAEESLRRSEKQFHRLFEDDLTGDFISTPEGEILLCNPAFARIFGFARAIDAAGTNIVDLYLDPRERQALVERLRKEGKTERLEAWRKRLDGEPIHIVENLVGHFDAQGELYEIKGYLFEDTQRKRAEEALRESEERFRILADANPLIIWVTDPTGRMQFVNRAYCEFFGTTLEKLQSEGWQPLVHPDDAQAYTQRYFECLRERKSYHAEARVRRHDGQWRWIESWGEPRFSASGAFLGIAGSSPDITERKRAEEALRELTATLESKVGQRTAELRYRTRQLQKLTLEMSQAEDRERERLAHILHEDLQQELAAAKFQLSIARSRITSEVAMQETIATVVEMLKDAIGKSRSLSHELSPVVLHQGDFAEALQWLAGQMQARHGLVVRVHGQAHLPSDGVKAFLYRTAQELLFNVVKHAQVQEARVRVRPCGGYVCLSVSDRGRGFDPAQLRETAGFGLLSIRERIELLGGRMKIRSAPGQGSTLFVVVPGRETPEDRGQKTEDGRETGEGALSSVLRPPSSRRSLRVLLADDHEVVRQGLIALLGEEGTIEVVGEAANGREAVDLADRLRPDVVLMDVSMPVMSGEEATREIKRDLPRTRIVSLTMREEPEVRERMQQAGADSYILKTAPYKELLAAIRGPDPSPRDLPYESAA